MELVPWRLGGSLGPFHKEINKMWDEFFRGPALTRRLAEWTPSIDMSETKDNFVVKAELPGVDPGDIILEFDQVPVKSLAQFQRLLDRYNTDDTILFFLKRHGTTLYLTLELQ